MPGVTIRARVCVYYAPRSKRGAQWRRSRAGIPHPSENRGLERDRNTWPGLSNERAKLFLNTVQGLLVVAFEP